MTVNHGLLRTNYNFWSTEELNRVVGKMEIELPCETCLVYPRCKVRIEEINKDYISSHCVTELMFSCEILKDYIYSWKGPFPLGTDNPFFVYVARYFKLDPD